MVSTASQCVLGSRRFLSDSRTSGSLAADFADPLANYYTRNSNGKNFSANVNKGCIFSNVRRCAASRASVAESGFCSSSRHESIQL